MMNNKILNVLDKLVPNPVIELDYTKDYELLIATMLSAQTTDIRVNKVTKTLFSEYDIFTLTNANINDIKEIIRSLGSYNKKAEYIIEISKSLVSNYNGIVPNNRAYLESLPGVGRKTANVVLKNLFGLQAIAVDTHVLRVSKRLGLAPKEADVVEVEKSLMKLLPEKSWSKVGDQILLFGRYHCTAKNPKCEKCPLINECKKDSL